MTEPEKSEKNSPPKGAGGKHSAAGVNARTLRRTPAYLFAVIILSIFVIEMVEMVFLEDMDFGRLELLLDPLFLAVLISPILYLSLFRPILLHIVERARAEEALERHKLHLEETVRKRTEGLTWLNAILHNEIEDRIKVENALKERDELLGSLTDSAPNAIVMMDDLGSITYWNPASEKTFGYPREEAEGKDLHSLIVPPEHYEAFSKGFETFKKTGRGAIIGKTLELKALRKGGTEFPVELSVSSVKIKERWNSIGIIRDITERKRSEKMIRELAFYDSLTGLPNRQTLVDRMTQTLARGRRQNEKCAVLFMDLDRFKDINDSLGHPAGDLVLKTVAEKLSKAVRSSDTVSRIGGDEFVVLLEDVKKTAGVTAVVEKIFSLFERPFRVMGEEFLMTTSMGVTIFPDDGEDPETLLKNADVAMYRAKEQETGKYRFYTPAMNARSLERLKLRNNLRRALEKEELLLYYQPQVNIKSGEVIGLEALVRWDDPERGIVLPGEFIDEAENSGLIVPIGKWSLEKACSWSRSWQKSGLKAVKMSVNISIRHFREKNFLKTIGNTLKKTGLDPGRLELEITESLLMEDILFSSRRLDDLKAMGVKLSIDDFGTGYSSFEYLKRMPLDVLKIAMPFVSDIAKNPDDRAIAGAIIQVGHTLGLEVIAEGVETVEQFKTLSKLGCDHIQGFLIARALPPEEVEAFLGKEKRFIVK